MWCEYMSECYVCVSLGGAKGSAGTEPALIMQHFTQYALNIIMIQRPGKNLHFIPFVI